MIIDNFLPIEDWKKCLDYFKGGNWCFPPLKGETTKTCVWRIFDPKIESAIGSILYDQLKQLEVQPFSVKRVGINGANPFNESHIHVDGQLGDYSLIWFGSPQWNPSWNGSLQIFKDEDCWKTNEVTKTPDVTRGITKIEYVPNRAVLFPAHLAHIPETPNLYAKNNIRLSVGLHLSPTEQWKYVYIPRTNG
jgi:hypothetical protein